MFGWRRRSEGFEWREYVRTTVLVRRAERHRKLDDARMAALAAVKDQRDRGVAAGKAAAEQAANQALDIGKAGASAAWDAISGFAVTTWDIAVAIVQATRESLPRVTLPDVKLPRVPVPDWLTNFRFSRVPKLRAERMLPDVGWRLPWRLPVTKRMFGGAAAIVALALGIGPMLNSGHNFTTAGIAPSISAPESTATISGHATAIGGDLVRVDGQVIRLAGIEAPEDNQPCYKSNGRKWNCGASAKSALEKLLRGAEVACARSGQDGDGSVLATCRIGNDDIAEALVRDGHVFALTGLFASYAAAEREAQSNGNGIWQGDSVRPKAWRDQTWAEAKKAAPEGCPIKGIIRASNRVYAMPWSHDYVAAKVRSVRGDRWFCSEDEARAAGFKLAAKL